MFTRRLEIAKARLARQKKILHSEQAIQDRLRCTLKLFEKDVQPESSEALAEQNKYLTEWNANRLEQYKTLPTVTVRINVPPIAAHSDRSGFALVRGIFVDGAFSRFRLDNLQVSNGEISNLSALALCHGTQNRTRITSNSEFSCPSEFQPHT
ncbi:unnamed protein product [Echinostoma caproni]|uniref:Uncharacterized protein n=1 Tax=Echinostoma caproni TaxID=27848 RepID=A0A183B6Y3_9TREM|nr:unnamed protein product [Echinostoma caproni]